jgi:hypothetical protein
MLDLKFSVDPERTSDERVAMRMRAHPAIGIEEGAPTCARGVLSDWSLVSFALGSPTCGVEMPVMHVRWPSTGRDAYSEVASTDSFVTG